MRFIAAFCVKPVNVISEMEDGMIELRNVTKSYDGGIHPIVEDISFLVDSWVNRPKWIRKNDVNPVYYGNFDDGLGENSAGRGAGL